MTLLNVDSGFDNRLCLHNCDFRIGNRKTATAMSHHRVELVETVAKQFDFFNGLALCLGKLLDVLSLGRHKLVKRRVQETDSNRHTLECFHKTFKVLLLHRLDSVECLFTLLNGV